jgi:cell division septation protein DedD
MMSYKGILKYLIYLSIAGWMFLLGIVVGRGTSPVTFDTKRFQERLEFIAKKSHKQKEQPPEKVELGFFGSLKDPIPTQGSASAGKTGEIIPKQEIVSSKERPAIEPGVIPKKLSRKTLTDIRYKNKKPVTPIKKTKPVTEPVKTADAVIQKFKENTQKKKSITPAPSKNKYTIQLASYTTIKEAQNHLQALKKKKIQAYVEKTTINGTVWHRVRTGSFETLDQARQFNQRFKKKKMDTLIIKLDED